MVRDAQDASGVDELAVLVGRVAAGAVGIAAVLLLLALVGELLRRRGRGPRVVAVLDRWLPLALRSAVVSLVTVATACAGVRPASAADSVRGWLGGEPATTTTTRTTTSTSTTTVPPTTTTSTTSAAAPELAPPLVLEPPVTFDDLEPPAPEAVAPPPAAPPAPPAPGPVTPAPVVRSAPPATVYIVAPGDCLWSIAARQLGPGADDRTIDATWRHIYAANHAAIGDDPNLIHPGLTLQLPPLDPQP